MPGIGVPKRTTIASLRHRVTIKQKTITSTDERGQPVYTWTNVKQNVPCRIQTLSGTEVEKARQLFAEATHRVEMRANADVTEQMKLVFGSRDLFIGFIDNKDQVGRFMWLICAEKK